MRKLTLFAATGLLLLGCIGVDRAFGQAADGPPEFAGIFGSRMLDVPNLNDPGNSYTMVQHVNDAAGYDALAYDPLRGWGFDAIYPDPANRPYGDRNGGGIFGPFDDSPNNRGNFADTLPDQLYDSFIGFKSYSTPLQSGTPETPAIGDPPEGGIFRIDVPNGSYRFVGVFGSADNNHTHRIVVEDGGSGPPEDIGDNNVVLVNNHDQAQYDIGPNGSGGGAFARVGFTDKLPPEALGPALPGFVNMDEFGMPTEDMPNSPILDVTQGYLRLHLLQGDTNDGAGGSGDANGSDIVLFEVYPVLVGQTLVWNGLGDGTWGAIDAGTGLSNWSDEAGSGADVFPDVDTPGAAIIDANTVTVAADREAISLSVNGGGVAIGGGSTLTVKGRATFADGTTLALADGATLDVAGGLTVGAGNAVALGAGASLSANNGSIDALTTSGDATVGVVRTMAVNSLSDGGTAGTFTKQGIGTLALADVSAAATIFNIEGGAVATTAANMLGGATQVTLDGGELRIDGEVGEIANLIQWARYNGGNNEANLAGIDDGVANGQNGGLFALTPSSSGGWTTATDDEGSGDNYAFMWSGDFTPPVTGDYTFNMAADDFEVVWIDLNTNGEFDGAEMVIDNLPPLAWNVNGNNGTAATVNLQQGTKYAFAAPYYENGGGEWGWLTITPPGGSEGFVNPSDPAQGGWWSGVGTLAIDATELDLTVTNDSTLNAVTDAQATFGNVTLKNGILTTTGAVGGIVFPNGVTIDAAAAGKVVGIDSQGPLDLGTIRGNSVDTTFAKAGSGTLVLDTPNEGLENATIEVRGGTLKMVGSAPWGGSTSALLSGGRLIIEAEAPQPLPPLAGAAALWSFDNLNGNTVVNEGSAGAAADGTLNGAAAVEPGLIGDALMLAGTGNYVDLGNPTDLDFGQGDWTVSLWAKTADPDGRSLYAKGGDNGGGIRYTLAVGEGGAGRATLTTDDDSDKRQATSSTDVADDQWHHIIGMRQGDQLSVYVDGQLDGTNTAPAGYNLATAQHGAYLGAITSHTDGSLIKYFTGMIDEVAVYGRALDQGEIGYMFGNGYGPNEGGTLQMTGHDFLVTADSVLETVSPADAAFGTLTLKSGVLTTAGTADSIGFTSTTVPAEATDVGVRVEVPTQLGVINVESPAAVISKSGPLDLVLTSANVGTGLQNATFEVQEGRLVGINDSNPFGAAGLSIRGAEFVLAAKDGSTDVTYDNALTVEDTGTLTAGSGGVGAVGPVTVTLGSETNGVTVNAGALMVDTTDDYTLNIAGSVTGTGGLQVLGGNVALAGGADIAALDISAGTLNLLADVNVASMQASGGVLNTGDHQVVVSDRLKLGQTIITAGDTPFTASGANLVDGSVADNLVFSGGTITVGAPSTPTDGLLAQWSFDDPAAPGRDDSGNLRDMELEGAEYDPVGKLGGALLFDGASRAIDDDAGDYLNGLAELTVAMWIKSDDTGIDRGFWEAVDSGGGDLWGVRYDSTGATAGGSNLFKVGMTFDTSGGNNNRGADQQESASDLQTTEWQHVAITWLDGEGFKMYVDGVLDEEPTSPMSTTDGVTDMVDYFVVGDGAKNNWQGLVDEVFIFEKALDADSVATLASGEFSTSMVELGNTNLTLVADTTVALVSEEDAEFGNLTLDPGVTLAIDGAAASFNDVTAAAGSTIQTEALLIRGVLSTGGNPGTITIDGELELLAEEGEGNAEYVADPAGDLLVVTEDVYLGGTLTLKAGSNMGDLSQGEWGESTRTILEVAGDEAAIIDTFVNEPAPGDHLGYGVFHQEVVYGDDETSVEVTVFQAAPGDTNGDREVNNTDLQAILGAGSFGAGDGWGWGQGDFNGDGLVNNGDLQQILATGLFGAGTYAAGAGATAVPEPGTLMLLASGLVGLFWLWRRRAAA